MLTYAADVAAADVLKQGAQFTCFTSLQKYQYQILRRCAKELPLAAAEERAASQKLY
jgi:hypothetical protein